VDTTVTSTAEGSMRGTREQLVGSTIEVQLAENFCVREIHSAAKRPASARMGLSLGGLQLGPEGVFVETDGGRVAGVVVDSEDVKAAGAG